MPWPCGKKVRAENRTIHVGNTYPPGVEVTVPEKYPDNRVTSSKYTKWTFIPKNLFEQFHRIANFYFLCVALVEVLIDSPVSPIITILPLVFVVIVTAVKQGYEDYLRHKADQEVNNRGAHVVRDGNTITVKAFEIRVGDIVKVTSNQGIPCDMVMLSSESPDGECYITTANLDGETNLKNFQCVPDTRHLITDSSFTTFRGTVECQQPVVDLYKFVGRIIVYEDGGTNSITHALSSENLLLRGCRLKNTPFIYGCASYTGQDTTISLNSKGSRAKFSRIERRMNTFLIVYLIALFLYAGTWVGLKFWWYQDELHSREAMWYTEPH
jgi:phospholipid-translocating ATPase